MSKNQVRTISELSRKLTNDVPRLAPDQQQVATDAIHVLHAQLAKYGSFERPAKPITPGDKTVIANAQAVVRSIPKAPAPAGPEAPRPAMADVVRTVAENRAQLDQNTAIPLEVKRPLLDSMGATLQQIARAGGADKLSAEQRRKIIEMGVQYEQVMAKYRPKPTPAPLMSAVPRGAQDEIARRNSLSGAAYIPRR
jgi:hypothetical protein